MALVAVFLSRVTGSAGSGPRRAFNWYESTEAGAIKLMTSFRERENTSSIGSPAEHLRRATRGTDTPYYAAVSLLSQQISL